MVAHAEVEHGASLQLRSQNEALFTPSLGAQQPLLAEEHPGVLILGWGGIQDTSPPALYHSSFPHTSWDLPSSIPKVLRQTCNCKEPPLSL